MTVTFASFAGLRRAARVVSSIALAGATTACTGAAGKDVGAAPKAHDSGTRSSTDAAPPADGMRDVLLVGNSVSGTVSVLDVHTLENLGSVDVLPDRGEVTALIEADPQRSAVYAIVKGQQLLHHFEPSGGDRFVDDVFVSPDGTVLYVSRSNLGDVAAFDLTAAGHPRLWRTFVHGFKADHATISPDGTRLVVSATTAQEGNVLDTTTGEIVGTFGTGLFPHQNDYSSDGRHIYNGSIGNVGYNAVSHADNLKKGDRWLVKVDAATLEVVKTWVFEYGIRPSIVTPDESTLYAQLSYLNGVIKYDLDGGVEVARSDQPLSAFALATYATFDEYPHDSAHHGLALSGDGTRLCDAGTIDNAVTLLSAGDLQVEHLLDVGMIPYWASTGADGKRCFLSMSGDDAVTVVEYASGAILKTVTVGRFPQRNRPGRIREQDIALLNASPG